MLRALNLAPCQGSLAGAPSHRPPTTDVFPELRVTLASIAVFAVQSWDLSHFPPENKDTQQTRTVSLHRIFRVSLEPLLRPFSQLFLGERSKCTGHFTNVDAAFDAVKGRLLLLSYHLRGRNLVTISG